MEDVKLIEEAQKGNKSALNRLLADNYNIVKGYIIKMTGDTALAYDITQETFLKAVINIKKFTPRAKFSTWLIKIATNVYRDYLRVNKTSEMLDETLISKEQGTEETVINRLQYVEMMKVLSELPYEKRAVFILKHYYGYKYEEIAEILNCPIGTVRSRLHNAIKSITAELERRKII